MSEEKTPHVFWIIDSTHPQQAAEIRGGLQSVMDPELGLSIIDLGLVRQASISDDRLLINMILTTPFCPYGPAMLDSTRKKAEEVSGLDTHIELGAEMWTPEMMDEDMRPDWGLY